MENRPHLLLNLSLLRVICHPLTGVVPSRAVWCNAPYVGQWLAFIRLAPNKPLSIYKNGFTLLL
jgi:hypothetical protein